MTETIGTMDSLDWDTLLGRYWDRAPVLVKQVSPPPFHADEVFHAAVACMVPPRPGVIPSHAQFTIDRDQATEPGPWLPQYGDTGWDGYEKRLTEHLHGRRYALVAHSFHAAHFPQWHRERAWLSPLWERIALPLSGPITALFHGTYEHSPVGVHLDRFSTFMYVVRGRKRMRFWPNRPWTQPVSSVLDYEPHLKSSLSIDVKEGQLLYWPSTYYHVGESTLDASPSTSVNVGIPRSGHRALHDIPDFLYDRTSHSLITPGTDTADRPLAPGALLTPTDGTPPPHPHLPPALSDALDAFRDATSPHGIRDRSAVLSLRRWTSGGLLPPPPPIDPIPLPDEMAVRSVEQVLWTSVSNGLVYSANGHTALTQLAPHLLAALLDQLEQETAHPVLSLLSLGNASSSTREQIREVLLTLESFRSLTRTL